MAPGGADDLLDGACTLIYMFMKWLRGAYEHHDRDVIAEVVPDLVETTRMMPRSIGPETIPTMAGLLVAAGTGLSPSLWRQQFGHWTRDGLTLLEATAFLLADRVNRLTGDPRLRHPPDLGRAVRDGPGLTLPRVPLAGAREGGIAPRGPAAPGLPVPRRSALTVRAHGPGMIGGCQNA